MDLTNLYRVVGVRADKNRRVICTGETLFWAERVKRSLLNGNVFLTVEIELDEQLSPGLDQSSDIGGRRWRAASRN
jgi:hypothetical protein